MLCNRFGCQYSTLPPSDCPEMDCQFHSGFVDPSSLERFGRFPSSSRNPFRNPLATIFNQKPKNASNNASINQCEKIIEIWCQHLLRMEPKWGPKSMKNQTDFGTCDFPGMGAGPGFSFSVGGPFGTLVPWTSRRGASKSCFRLGMALALRKNQQLLQWRADLS